MRSRFALCVLLCSISNTARANSDLASMELEQLMDMNVTTVSKREQNFSSAAAAIYTISQEDIRRSAATNLPDILRQAPGMEVARINPSMWAITARGFNSQFANKLLVLVDGRSIYTPLFSGVYWDAQMPTLDDIQRIEIIRGPGASLWGSNAVNGVINIITYDSEQTLGSRVTTGIGNEERGFLRARQGFRQGNLTGRVSAQYRKSDEAQRSGDSIASNDDDKVSQVGARFDWRPTPTSKSTLDLGATETDKNVDVYVPQELAPLVIPRSEIGAHSNFALANWLQQLANGDAVFLQSYITYDHRFDPLNSAKLFTADYELQYNHKETAKQRITWGINQRYTRDEIVGSFIVYTDDAKQNFQLNTAFAQDEIRVTDTLNIALGLKVEDSNTTAREFQPSVRLSSLAIENSTFWVSASRAARTPSRLETSMEFRTEAPSNIRNELAQYYPWLTGYSVVRGNADFNSEILKAYEAGWRLQANTNLLVDMTTYLFDYERLLTYLPPPAPDHIDDRYLDINYLGVVVFNKNVSQGKAKGAEISLDYLISDQWKMKTTYSYFNFVSSRNPYNMINLAVGFERQSPQHQARLTSYHTLSNTWEFDWTLRYVAELLEGYIPAYTELDIRLGKKLTSTLNLSVVGKNMLDPAKPEFIDINYGPLLTEIQRSLYVQLDWRL